MNRITTIILYFIFAFHFSASAEVKEELNDPYTMVKHVTNQAFQRMKSERKNITSNPKVIEEIVEQEILPFVDYRFSALKVLGKYFRHYEKEQIEEYVDVFRGYSVSVVSNALKFYDDQTVEFEPPQDVTGEKHAVVRIRINNADKPIKLSFLTRKDSRTNEWRVYDIIAEGISMLSSLRSEYGPILRKNGLEEVIKTMKVKEK